jgi:hypothetical protein
VFSLELPIALKADGSLVVGVTTGVTQSASFTGGIIYKHGQWNSYQSSSKSFTFNPPTPYIGIELRGYLEPKLQLKLYGVAGPYATIEPYIKFEAASNQTPWWILSAGIEAKVGVEIEVLGHSLGTDTELALGYNVIVAQASDPPLPTVQNGDFELGRYNGWSETSANGFPLVVDDDLAQGFPPGFTPRSGEWQVWLGGWADERGTIRQDLTLPNTTPIYLHHYYKVKAHGQVCGFADYAQVLVNGEVVMEKDLCVSEHTSNWTLEAIDISDYAGQQVSIMFLAQTDGNSDTSSYFIDDVSLSQHPSGFLLNLEAEAPIAPGADEVLTAVP